MTPFLTSAPVQILLIAGALKAVAVAGKALKIDTYFNKLKGLAELKLYNRVPFRKLAVVS